MTAALELRCPNTPGRLFAKIVGGVNPPVIVEGNLVEMHCPDCTREYRRRDFPQALARIAAEWRVVHRYNLAGECVETETVPR